MDAFTFSVIFGFAIVLAAGVLVAIYLSVKGHNAAAPTKPVGLVNPNWTAAAVLDPHVPGHWDLTEEVTSKRAYRRARPASVVEAEARAEEARARAREEVAQESAERWKALYRRSSAGVDPGAGIRIAQTHPVAAPPTQQQS